MSNRRRDPTVVRLEPGKLSKVTQFSKGETYLCPARTRQELRESGKLGNVTQFPKAGETYLCPARTHG